jgi:hypothetical protein
LNKKIKKKLSIIFINSREEKLGLKDIDHILPFLFFLSKTNKFFIKIKILIFNDKITFLKSADPRIKFLFNLKNVELIFLYDNLLLSKLKNLLTLKGNSNLVYLFNRIIKNFYFNFLELKKKDIIFNYKIVRDFINSKNLLIATTFIHNKIPEIIKKINKSSKWMVIPHGTTLLDNKMVTDNDLSKQENTKPTKDTDKVDYILNTSKEDLNRMIFFSMPKSKQHVIGSPRYCKDWLKVKSKYNLDGKNRDVE